MNTLTAERPAKTRRLAVPKLEDMDKYRVQLARMTNVTPFPAKRPIETPCQIACEKPVAVVDASAMGQVHLFGAFRVVAPDGRDITPKGTVRRALLALLATGKEGTRTRAFLQAMLWGDRAHPQATSSLRNALCVLKAELEALGDDVIVADNTTIRLNLDKIWIDAIQGLETGELPGARMPTGAAFLDGMDFFAARDCGFEEWVVTQRAYWSIKMRVVGNANDRLAKVAEG